MSRRWLSLVLFLAMFGFYAHFAAPSVTTGDSGEFITAAATLAIPHAPSFPTFVILGKSFLTAVPFGSLPYRSNIFSAFVSALTLVVLLEIVFGLTQSSALSVLTVILTGLTVSFLENSLVTEVFALNTLFVALLVLAVLRQQYTFAAFLLGLGLGNHQVLLFIGPAVLVYYVWNGLPLKEQLSRDVGRAVVFFALGVSIYLVLPIRSAKEPPLNWGQPTTVAKFTRTVTRKDYGSLKLALGDAPERNMPNTVKHMRKFFEHLAQEVPLPALVLGFWAFATGLAKRDRNLIFLFVAFLLAGPFFFWLGNLPFNAQSDGIVGRFLIMPVVLLLLAAPAALLRRPSIGAAILALSIAIGVQGNVAQAEVTRDTRLVLDYGRAMLRTLPLGATLFMDGGDDAFYSLAMLHYVHGGRPDVRLHDRGGLVFKSPYGSDFRSITKEQKKQRRIEVESAALARGPVFYSTMDKEVVPGVPLVQRGFLMQAAGGGGGSGNLWPVLVLRSLYPLEPNNYRMRALGAFFPFMRGRELLHANEIDASLRYFQRATLMGADVDWLKSNLGSEYALTAYAKLVANDFVNAEKLYRQWIAFEPDNVQPCSNLGVVLEKSGRIAEAKAQYEQTKKLFPTAADPVFNLAVLAWKENDWPTVVSNLEEVLRRKPDHAQAAGYLRIAHERMGKRG